MYHRDKELHHKKNKQQTVAVPAATATVSKCIEFLKSSDLIGQFN